MSAVRTLAALVATQLAMTAVVVAPAARAQAVADVAAAEVLFDEGRSLMDKGRTEEACPKLEESLRLDTGIGTMLWLAECYQRLGRVASAWAQFRQASSMADKQSDPRAATARKKAAALEPRLPKLAIEVAATSRVEGLEITRDGAPVSAAMYGTEIPIDPGPHVIVARAPGRVRWEQKVDAKEGQLSKLEIPTLESLRAVQPLGPEAPKTPDPVARRGLRHDEPRVAPAIGRGPWLPLAIGLGAVGVASIGAGAFFGLRAMDRDAASTNECPSSVCSREGAALREDAFAAARLSTIFFGVGLAAIGGGAAVYLLRPKASLAIAPSVGVRFTGVTVEGRF